MDRIINLLYSCILICGVLPLSYGVPEHIFADHSPYDESLYGQVKDNLQQYNESFVIDYTGNTKELDKQLQAVMQKVRETNPYVHENISKWHANYKYTSSKATIEFSIDYLTNATNERFVDAEIKRLANALVHHKMSDIEKIKSVHDYLIANTTYSADTKASQYTTYAILTENKGVCQGYAFFMYRMLEELGFEVQYVKGHANGELHGWVLVKVGNNWYHIDATWNDPLPDRGDNVRYKYFLVSDVKMKETHSWDEAEYPKANSEKYTAFHVADFAYTKGKELIYQHAETNQLYAMNLKTLRSTKLNEASNYE